MVTGPQISLKNISLTFGEEPVFDKLNLIINPRDRIALVGRNGSGKSTLLKVLKGLIAQDGGERILGKGLSIGYMEQEPNLSEFSTLYDYVYSGASDSTFNSIEMVGKKLGVDLEVSTSASSGGERRRAALTKLIAGEYDVMLLDEPTNHLDIQAKEALEDALTEYDGTLVIVSHDRYFLDQVCNTIWHLPSDGSLKVYPGNYSAFMQRLSK